ncbi:MAG: hypothetical protein ACLFVO_18740 [Chloroflexaceae bacterium]
MKKQAVSGKSARSARAGLRKLPAWWRQTGEPVVLTGLALPAFSIPLLLLLDLLTHGQAVRLMLGLIWLAGGLLLLRLPRLLRQERRRLAVIATVGSVAIAFTFFISPRLTMTTLAEPAAQEGEPEQSALPPPQADAELTFKALPRISRQVFSDLLHTGTGGTGRSPAAPYADELYEIIVSYELDPAVALAFFAQESQFCTTGICRSHDMKSWGGQRAAFDPQRSAGIVRGRYGNFVSFRTWQDSVRDWCELILSRYIGRGLDTVEKAIPVYAPAWDNNVPSIYINNVRLRVAVWQGRAPGPPPADGTPRYDDLETGLVMESFEATGQEYFAEWAFHKYVVEEARAGRPVGSPLDESRTIIANGRRYAVQTFTLDTLYTPLADIESETDWSDVRRLSELIRAENLPAAEPSAPEAPAPEDLVPEPQSTAPTALPLQQVQQSP